MIHIDTTTQRMATRLSVHGQLDLTAVGAFDEALTEAARGGGCVEIDLGEVDFIDGSGLRMLMDAENHARHASHRLRVVAASRCVRRLIDITATADRLSPLPGAPAQPTGEVTRK
jgi:anti-sigma B factor antagonist